MNRLVVVLPLLALVGCKGKPCDVSSDCGGGEVCASSRCQALTCNEMYTAVDPYDGTCRAVPVCAGPDEQSNWVTCNDPCPALGEWDCIAEPACQPVFGVDRVYQSCRANGPALRDPCAGLGREACDADFRCVAVVFDVDCECDGEPGSCGKCRHVECQARNCGEMHENECAENARCSTNQNQFFPGPAPFDAGVPSSGFVGCLELHAIPCFALTGFDCRRRPDCHAIDTGGVVGCEPDDGMRRCDSSSECGANRRCNNDEACAPPSSGAPQMGPQRILPSMPPPPPGSCAGVCVPLGCAGNGERRCNQDPSCEPIYALQCSPYGGGCQPPSGSFPVDGGTEPMRCSSFGDPSCEPSFLRCSDGPGGEVDPDRSILTRDPTVVDHVTFSFPSVMARLAGARTATEFVEHWFGQLAVNINLGERFAAKRTQAAAYFLNAPHTSDGKLDIARLDFQVTSLANRIDLAGPNDCGEARITYALKGGVTDRRHRMTIIVELKQPDDGARCRTVAEKWVALSRLEGAALRDALIAIYDPLLTPPLLNQVRSNEFLVGPDFQATRTDLPWELREWQLGSDGLLHLALSKQALDPSLVKTPSFVEWLGQNRESVIYRSAVLPDQFLAATSSENGARLTIDGDFEAETALNQMACAGCHTTETNTAFVHVGERFLGSGRAQISEVLRRQLPGRARHLAQVANGRLTIDARLAVKLSH